jgi:hypothetical protein
MWLDVQRNELRDALGKPRVYVSKYARLFILSFVHFDGDEFISMNYGHKRAYWSYPRWYMSMEPWWNDMRGKCEEVGDEPVPVPVCSPQIPQGLTRARTQASAVRGRRVTMTLPCLFFTQSNVRLTWQSSSQKVPPLICWLIAEYQGRS